MRAMAPGCQGHRKLELGENDHGWASVDHVAPVGANKLRKLMRRHGMMDEHGYFRWGRLRCQRPGGEPGLDALGWSDD